MTGGLTDEKIANFVGRIRVGKSNCLSLKDVAINVVVVREFTDEVIPIDCLYAGFSVFQQF